MAVLDVAAVPDVAATLLAPGCKVCAAAAAAPSAKAAQTGTLAQRVRPSARRSAAFALLNLFALLKSAPILLFIAAETAVTLQALSNALHYCACRIAAGRMYCRMGDRLKESALS